MYSPGQILNYWTCHWICTIVIHNIGNWVFTLITKWRCYNF